MRWIEEDELLEITGYKSRGWLAKALTKQGIKYITGRGGKIIVPESVIAAITDEKPEETIEFI